MKNVLQRSGKRSIFKTHEKVGFKKVLERYDGVLGFSKTNIRFKKREFDRKLENGHAELVLEKVPHNSDYQYFNEQPSTISQGGLSIPERDTNRRQICLKTAREGGIDAGQRTSSKDTFRENAHGYGGICQDI
jgi:hypothetical protein